MNGCQRRARPDCRLVHCCHEGLTGHQAAAQEALELEGEIGQVDAGRRSGHGQGPAGKRFSHAGEAAVDQFIADRIVFDPDRADRIPARPHQLDPRVQQFLKHADFDQRRQRHGDSRSNRARLDIDHRGGALSDRPKALSRLPPAEWQVESPDSTPERVRARRDPDDLPQGVYRLGLPDRLSDRRWQSAIDSSVRETAYAAGVELPPGSLWRSVCA